MWRKPVLTYAVSVFSLTAKASVSSVNIVGLSVLCVVEINRCNDPTYCDGANEGCVRVSAAQYECHCRPGYVRVAGNCLGRFEQLYSPLTQTIRQ